MLPLSRWEDLTILLGEHSVTGNSQCAADARDMASTAPGQREGGDRHGPVEDTCCHRIACRLTLEPWSRTKR